MKPFFCDEIVIRIKPVEEIIQIYEHKGGTISTKNIDLDELIKCFESGIKETKIVQSGLLPDNCLSYDISNKVKTLAIFVPAHYIDYIYYKTVYEHFPMPNMVFSISIGPGGKTSQHRLTVVGNGKPNLSAALYEYPFSNVYDTGSICMGAANTLPVYKSLHTLSSLPDFILSLPNNDHLFLKSNNQLKLGYRDLLEHLKDKDPSYYYTHILVPRKNSKATTLQDFIENKLGGRL